MILLLLLCLAAQARTLALVVGAREFWTDACALAEHRADCLNPDKALSYADDDAWRAAYLLQTLVTPGDLRVLTTPDDSTRDRPFPGGPPDEPTRAKLLATLQRLRGPPDREPTTVVLFIAAHGTPGEVHLADGRADFEQLRQEVLGLLGPQDELVLIADACNSARWRSADYGVKPMPYFPPVQASRGRLIEALVDGLTPEDDEISGGVFTYITLSAWMGAGDSNGDGVVSAQELQDQLFRYAAAGSRAPFAPVVRAPSGSSTYPLPAPQRGGALRFQAEGPARWLILVPGDEPDAPRVVLGEIFTEAGRAGQVVLPPGRYEIARLPCTWDPARRAFAALSDTATISEVTVETGQTTPVPESGREVVLRRKGVRGELGQTIDQLPVAALEALPAGRARYHGGSRWWIGLGMVASSPVLSAAGRDAPLAGPQLSLRRPLSAGWLQITGSLGALSEVGGTETSTLQFARAGLDLQGVTYSRPHLFSGPVAGLGLAFGTLTGPWNREVLRQAYLAPDLQLGARLALVQRKNAGVVSVLWSPSWIRIDEEQDQGDVLARWRIDPWQLQVKLGGERRW